MSSSADTLVLVGQLNYQGSIGFGDLYRLSVLRAEPPVAEQVVRVTVVAGDRTSAELFAAHQSPAVVEVTFMRGASDQPYHTVTVTGFVDPDGTAWVLEGVRPVETDLPAGP
jgi:hypothetical protein